VFHRDGWGLSLLRCDEICQHAARDLHCIGEREGSSLLEVSEHLQAHFGGAVFGVVFGQPLSPKQPLCPFKDCLQPLLIRWRDGHGLLQTCELL
jgi:hypothetical protein